MTLLQQPSSRAARTAATGSTTAPTANEPPLVTEAEETRRVLHSIDGSALTGVIGSLVAGYALAWILLHRLFVSPGWFGMLVLGYVLFLTVYVVVTLVDHDRIELADRVAAVVATSAALVVLAALALVIGYTVSRGLESMSHLNFYTQDLSDAGPQQGLDTGGIVHAVAGTLIELAIAICIALPLGILTAVFLTEVKGPWARPVRTVVEAMTALPSIVAGLFIYIVLLIVLGLPLSGFCAACAISVMMLPIIARAAEVVLRLVPGGLREAGLALGASEWQTVWRVVLPTARPGLATALVLGTARGIGETSPVLLTAGYTTYLNTNPLEGPMPSLPLLTYMLARSPEQNYIVRAFGAASVLLIIVVVLFAFARWIAGRGAGAVR